MMVTPMDRVFTAANGEAWLNFRHYFLIYTEMGISLVDRDWFQGGEQGGDQLLNVRIVVNSKVL